MTTIPCNCPEADLVRATGILMADCDDCPRLANVAGLTMNLRPSVVLDMAVMPGPATPKRSRTRRAA